MDRHANANADLPAAVHFTRELREALERVGCEPVAILAALGQVAAEIIHSSDPWMRERIAEQFKSCFDGVRAEMLDKER